MKFKMHINTLQKQQGAVLVVALVFMGILTMLGISAMRSSTLDLKIHNAMKNKLNAFQCAEAALRRGEIFIKDAPTKPSDMDAGIPDKNASMVWITNTMVLDNVANEDDAWWVNNGWEDSVLSDADLKVGCNNSARYIVQSLGGVETVGGGDLSFKAEAESQVSGYRITSRSEGVSSNSSAVLQSTFIRQFH